MNIPKKIINILISLVIIICILFWGIKTSDNIFEDIIIKNNISNSIEQSNQTKIVFLGDMMLTRGVETSVKNNFNGDYNKLFDNLTELKEADITYANLEGPISSSGNNVGSKYSFRMNLAVIDAIKNAGFDILSFANNHVGDWNMQAFKDTLTSLDNIGIYLTGAGFDKKSAESPIIIEKNGIRFGFLSFSDVGPVWMKAEDKSPGILISDNLENLKNIIKTARIKSDVLIVSFHWGEEYKLKHNKRQETLAHLAIDSGADVIIGHHPHVIEDVEEYMGKPIVYSLGNFIFDQYFSKDTMRGMLFELNFENTLIKSSDIKIITLNKKYQPEGIFTLDEIKKRDAVSKSNCPTPKQEYSDMSLFNIGKETSLSDITYIPKNLTELNLSISTKKGICLTEETQKAFTDMAQAAKNNGNIIKVSSGFRDYTTQNSLFKESFKKDEVRTLISIAKPGHSEHQLGTTVDITGSSINYDSASNRFENTKEDLWLRDNAYLYGFIQSYPSGKDKVTGYMYEPWHYRYVGYSLSKTIKESGLTIIETLD